jgi:exodeoxyribonuclease V beta subunit
VRTAPEVEPPTTGPVRQDEAAPEPFDLCGELPSGTTVLEASAGTGKTYAIAALAARYIAEGVAELGQLMLVTFGRMATNELRLRVRERLVGVEARLARMLEQPAGSGIQQLGQPIDELLCHGSAGQLRARHERVAAALAEFDSATIATTHEFCLHMLDGLGVLGDREPNAVFVEHLTELTREVASDVYLGRYAASGVPPLSFDAALTLAAQADGSVHATLVPQGLDAAEYPDASERHAFAMLVRAEVERRKLAGRLFTYDDMLTRLRDALADPQHGPAAANRLRARYRIVMVDEFQDTDPIQWEILRRAFHGHTTLILIGDPKQAIYAFRGADVYSYLDAVRQADHLRTLATNWRSDAALVSSLHTLMGGTALGDLRIVVRPVTADHLETRLLSATGGESGESRSDSKPAPAFRLRVIEHAPDAEVLPRVGELRPRITADLVTDVVELLSSGSRLVQADPGGRQAAEPGRPIGPSDIAVLVRTNDRGEAIRDALIAAGVPAVMLGASSVYASTMAEDWLTLLTALEQPRQSLVRRAALTCFFGWTFEKLATADERAQVELSQRVRSWTRVLGARGVAALVEAVTTETGLPERLLRRVGGERQLTDLRHIGQNLHAAMVAGQLGISALVEWLRERMAEARGSGLSDRTRRLETDAEAVTVLTVHASKGLEFPVVYLPDAWDQHVETRDDGRTLTLHVTDVDGNSVCQLDVGGRLPPGRADRFARDRAEDSGEQLRLLYVAMTRAKCQVVTWWAPSRNTPASALQRFLYRPAGQGVEPLATYPLDGDPRALPLLQQGFSVETVSPRTARRWQIPSDAPALAGPRTFDRDLDLAWRRTSYSSLTAAAHGINLSPPGVGSEAEPVKEDDETLAASNEATSHRLSVGQSDQVSPMQDLPSGVEFGTIVHAIFEAVDPTAADLPAALREAATSALARTPAGELTAEALGAALLPAMDTPLGPLAGSRRLRDIAIQDRLAELVFELPLAGGDATTAALTLGMLAPMLRRHLGPDDPLHGYADLLEHPILADETLRGYLNGSIDAVLRVRDSNSVPHYLVVDYKTNWLGGLENGPLLLADYEPRRLAEAMMAANYPLQALLYLVAVHRLLRWRQPGYDPATHLGGALYLFVRGMAGPDTPQVNGVPYGVFSWQPPPALVTELSDLLHGRLP